MKKINHETVLNKILANLTPDFTNGRIRWFTIYDDSEGVKYIIHARLLTGLNEDPRYEILKFFVD
jgi:hypothetical protein